jgi:hypothetical protein
MVVSNAENRVTLPESAPTQAMVAEGVEEEVEEEGVVAAVAVAGMDHQVL